MSNSLKPITNKSTNNRYWPSVNLYDLRQAWSLIVSLRERQNIVDTLMRAVRRLVVINLHQLLVIQPPDGLDDAHPTCDEIAIEQQKLVNLFIILYECPFATDPLHFEVSKPFIYLSVRLFICFPLKISIVDMLLIFKKFFGPFEFSLEYKGWGCG
ncbi:unnamed protein product [Trichobilharzia regenti]|nr:unnamed protein product [Trichobilharzia regenti]